MEDLEFKFEKLESLLAFIIFIAILGCVWREGVLFFSVFEVISVLIMAFIIFRIKKITHTNIAEMNKTLKEIKTILKENK